MNTLDSIRKSLYAVTIRSRKVLALRRGNGEDLSAYYRALDVLERQLEASQRWTLQAHLKMVQALREELIALQSLNHRARYIRAKIADLLYQNISMQ